MPMLKMPNGGGWKRPDQIENGTNDVKRVYLYNQSGGVNVIVWDKVQKINIPVTCAITTLSTLISQSTVNTNKFEFTVTGKQGPIKSGTLGVNEVVLKVLSSASINGRSNYKNALTLTSSLKLLSSGLIRGAGGDGGEGADGASASGGTWQTYSSTTGTYKTMPAGAISISYCMVGGGGCGGSKTSITYGTDFNNVDGGGHNGDMKSGTLATSSGASVYFRAGGGGQRPAACSNTTPGAGGGSSKIGGITANGGGGGSATVECCASTGSPGHYKGNGGLTGSNCHSRGTHGSYTYQSGFNNYYWGGEAGFGNGGNGASASNGGYGAGSGGGTVGSGDGGRGVIYYKINISTTGGAGGHGGKGQSCDIVRDTGRTLGTDSNPAGHDGGDGGHGGYYGVAGARGDNAEDGNTTGRTNGTAAGIDIVGVNNLLPGSNY